MVKSPNRQPACAVASRVRARAGVARLVLMTDFERLPEPDTAIASLPAGSLVILRDYGHAEREALARSLKQACQQAGCWFLVAGDHLLARKVGADGVHLPEHLARAPLKTRSGFRLVSAACHSRRSIARAKVAGADLAIVSPVFPTESHPGKSTLGVHRFARLIPRAGLPVAALGGITYKNAAQLRGLKLAAVAGISGLTG